MIINYYACDLEKHTETIITSVNCDSEINYNDFSLSTYPNAVIRDYCIGNNYTCYIMERGSDGKRIDHCIIISSKSITTGDYKKFVLTAKVNKDGRIIQRIITIIVHGNKISANIKNKYRYE